MYHVATFTTTVNVAEAVAICFHSDADWCCLYTSHIKINDCNKPLLLILPFNIFQCIFRSFREHILLVYHVATFIMTVKVAETVFAFTVMHTGVACTHPT